jgi:excisionase family DNA binding protein
MPRAAQQPERIRAERASLILGVSLRTVQEMAARGELPGAAKIGKLWTFNEAEIRTYIRERQACRTSARHRQTPIGEATHFTAGSPSTGGLTEKAYILAMQRLRSGALQR